MDNLLLQNIVASLNIISAVMLLRELTLGGGDNND